MSFGGGHSTHRPLSNWLDSSSARLGWNRALFRICYCRRGLMLSGPPVPFNAGLIVWGVLVVFFLVAFVLGRNKKPVKVEIRN